VINFLKNYTTHLVVCNIFPSESNTKIKHIEKFPSSFGGDAFLENRHNLGKSPYNWGECGAELRGKT
jgi:hypothetical protein